MARPNVYTYFDDSEHAPPNQCNLLRLWARSWTARGWAPRILTARNAREYQGDGSCCTEQRAMLAAKAPSLCDVHVMNFSYRPHKPSKFKIIVVPYLSYGWEIAPLVSFENIHDMSVIEHCGRPL